MSCDQQHILKEMIHLYLEEWQFSERGQKVINRFKIPQITRDYTQNQNKWDFCYVMLSNWTKRLKESKAANESIFRYFPQSLELVEIDRRKLQYMLKINHSI